MYLLKIKNSIWMATLLAAAVVSGAQAMGKTPPDTTQSGKTDNTTSPRSTVATPPPANPFYNPSSNTGTAGPAHQSAVPAASATDVPSPEPGSSAATGVGPYGGAPAGPQGGR